MAAIVYCANSLSRLRLCVARLSEYRIGRILKFEHLRHDVRPETDVHVYIK